MRIKKKRILWITAIILLLGIIISSVSVILKDISHFESVVYVRDESKPTKILVLSYSRNGNTEAMAKEIAKHYNADLIFIEAEAYSRDLKGNRKASNDASDHTESPIEPKVLGLADYDLIFMGSPIWWYRPRHPKLQFTHIRLMLVVSPAVLFGNYFT
ncbi:MAG: hypothetical protein GY863_04595 [bacterium]|nr:hypothetical protein [bacterium]